MEHSDTTPPLSGMKEHFQWVVNKVVCFEATPTSRHADKLISSNMLQDPLRPCTF